MADQQRLEERIRDSSKRWYFTKEELLNSPSRINGIDPDKELSYRQQAANMIQDMGQRLSVYVANTLPRRCVALCPLGAPSGDSLGILESPQGFPKGYILIFGLGCVWALPKWLVFHSMLM